VRLRRRRPAEDEIAVPDTATAVVEPDPAPGEGSRPAAELDAMVGEPPGTRRRGRLRRRLRHLRRVREVLLRDLGGLTFELHRSAAGDGGSGGVVLEDKLERLAAVDAELRALEAQLNDHRAMIVREPGIGGTCSECGELFGSEARFCWACGNAVLAGNGSTPHLAVRTTRAQLAAPAAVPEPNAIEQHEGTWLEHRATAQDDPGAETGTETAADPTAPLPRMDPETVEDPDPPAPNEPATGDVGGDDGTAEPASFPLTSDDPLRRREDT